MTIYPTLCKLAGLPVPEHAGGASVESLLRNPEAQWNQPAITTHGYKNHAIRTEKWRYIRYADGSEELYDHENDPYEWTNLAGDRQYADVIREHARWLPKTNAAPAKGGNGVKKKKAKTKAKKSL